MPTGLETQVAGAEMERVLPLLPTLFDRDVKFYTGIEKKKAEVVSARDMRIPLELRPGGKFGLYDPEGGDMGRGDASTYDKALINVVYFKFAVEWTMKAEMATDDSRKSVVNYFRDQLAKGMKEFRRHSEAACMGDGTGTVGVVESVSVGGGVDGGDRVTLDADLTTGMGGYGAKLVRFGQDVNAFNSALSTNRTAGAERTIVFHDLANKIIDLKTPSVTGLIAGDKIVISGVTGTPPVALLGVPYHHSNASTGLWLGLNRATTPEIRANRVNAGGALALPHARLAVNKIGDRVGLDEGVKLEAWTHPAQAQAYEELGQLVTMINKAPKEEGLNLYFDTMQLAGVPLRQSFMWDRTRIDFVAKEFWGRSEMKPAGFFERNGQRLFIIRGASGGVAAATVFYITCAWNLFDGNTAAASYIDALSVPTGYN